MPDVEAAVIGPGSLIESGLRPHRWSLRGRLEAVVLDPDGVSLWHYWRAQDRPDRPWVRADPVTDQALGPGVISWSPGASGRSGALVVSVPGVDGPARFRSSGSGPWQRSDPTDGRNEPESDPLLSEARTALARHLTGQGKDVRGITVARTSLGGRTQALVDEAGSLFQYHRLGAGAEARWIRLACLRLADPEPFTLEPIESVRIAQVSGETDLQPTPWGEPRPTLSSSVSVSGVLGTDLGVRVEHAGRSFLLCGDTHWHRRPWLSTRDAIAEITPQGPLAGLPGVRFHGSPLKLTGAGLRERVTMREYDVPLDGFSHDGEFYGFFTSNHFAAGQVMGRSVLARAEDPSLPIGPSWRRRPLRFRMLGTFSREAFLNVSVQVVGRQLWIWGSGPYRAGDLSLAVLDLDVAGPALRASRRLRPSDLGVRYWAGQRDGEPVWSAQEAEARPLVAHGAFGELSVRWVPDVERFLLLAGAGPEDPIGPAVTLRTARNPWGPWSPRRRLLDWVTTGMAPDPFSRFIRASLDDPIADRIFGAQAGVTGAAYAPYFFDAAPDGEDLRLRYTLSTWNPYQVVLMQHRLDVATL